MAPLSLLVTQPPEQVSSAGIKVAVRHGVGPFAQQSLADDALDPAVAPERVALLIERDRDWESRVALSTGTCTNPTPNPVLWPWPLPVIGCHRLEGASFSVRAWTRRHCTAALAGAAARQRLAKPEAGERPGNGPTRYMEMFSQPARGSGE